MSPLALRRYRAERMLRSEFGALRERVVGVVRQKLRARGLSMDDSDLEACYSQAWQGLYGELLAGTEIENVPGWLVTVCFRRAIDEQRLRVALAAPRGEEGADAEQGSDAVAAGSDAVTAGSGGVASGRDVAEELDDRAKLRQVMEGMRSALSQRELEAATLCYLQGFTRAEAAREMGVSLRGMDRLMEGRGSRGAGVAAKVGEIVRSISSGSFCEERGSLMRAFAFGVLDPEGERFALAQAHCEGCPACRAYVRSLRGLSAALPPVFLRGPLASLLRYRAQAPGDGAGRARRGGRRSQAPRAWREERRSQALRRWSPAARGSGGVSTFARRLLPSVAARGAGAKLVVAGLAIAGAGASVAGVVVLASPSKVVAEHRRSTGAGAAPSASPGARPRTQTAARSLGGVPKRRGRNAAATGRRRHGARGGAGTLRGGAGTPPNPASRSRSGSGLESTGGGVPHATREFGIERPPGEASAAGGALREFGVE